MLFTLYSNICAKISYSNLGWFIFTFMLPFKSEYLSTHFQAPEPWGKSSHIYQKKKKSTSTAYNSSSKLNKYDKGPG